MSDRLERLRREQRDSDEAGAQWLSELCREAADEIARLREKDAEIARLLAERGVLLNGARVVAAMALPLLKALPQSHEQGEAVRLAESHIAQQTVETNDYAVRWMREYVQRAERAEADAERYRYLKASALPDYAWDRHEGAMWHMSVHDPKEKGLNAAIDAARRESCRGSVRRCVRAGK